MHVLFPIMRLMTHVNIGATLALVGWLVTQSCVPSGSNTPGAAVVRSAVASSAGVAR